MEKRFMKDFDEKAYIHANYPKYRELGLNSWDEVGEYLKKNPPYPKMDGEMLKKAENLNKRPRHADPRPTSQTGSRRRAVPLLRSGEPVR
jgi:hypothetical protein